MRKPSIRVLLAAIACAPAAHAVEPLHDLAAFERWAAASVECRGDFLEAVQSRAFLDGLAAIGVSEKSPWQEGDLPEGELVARTPVRIAGQPVTRFRYWGDSGSEFFAIVAAPAADIARALDVPALPQKLRGEFDERTVAARFARAAKKGERLAPALFVRRAESGDGSEVGCRRFDG